MTYSQQKTAVIILAAILAGLAIIQAANAADFGLGPIAMRWLGVLGAVLGVLAGFLPSVRGMSTDPTFLEHRISELPEKKRRALATKLANRAAKDAEARYPRKVTESMSDDEIVRRHTGLG